MDKGERGRLELIGPEQVKFVPDPNGYLTVWEHPGHDTEMIRKLNKDKFNLQQKISGELEKRFIDIKTQLEELNQGKNFVIGAVPSGACENDPCSRAVVIKCPRTVEQEEGITGQVVAELHDNMGLIDFVIKVHKLGNYYKDTYPAYLGVGTTVEGKRMIKHLEEESKNRTRYDCLLPYYPHEGPDKDPGFKVTEEITRTRLNELTTYVAKTLTMSPDSELVNDMDRYNKTSRITNRLVALTLAYETYLSDAVDKTITIPQEDDDYTPGVNGPGFMGA